MDLSRRGFVYSTGTLAMIAAFGPGFQQAASAAPTLTGEDLETLRKRWVDSLTGREFIPAAPATFAAAITALDTKASGLLGRVSPTDTRFFDNRDWAAGSSATANSNNMRMNYVDLQSIAIAWVTPGSIHEGSSSVLDVLKQGLAHMQDKVYNTNTTWWGNCWS